jgi:hypothetical protein
MNIDLRIPMGMMFTLIGAVLMAFGLSTRANAALYAPSLGIDINLWWGLVLLAFGLVLVPLGRRGQMRIEQERGDANGGKPASRQARKSAEEQMSRRTHSWRTRIIRKAAEGRATIAACLYDRKAGTSQKQSIARERGSSSEKKSMASRLRCATPLFPS